MYTLGAAARATGKSKTTINRAVKSGRISAAKDTEGGYRIDPAELHRVYPPVTPQPSQGNRNMDRHATAAFPPANGGAVSTPETVALQRLLAEREETIRDLRRRLDVATEGQQREAEERRRLLAMLTDQRTIATPAPAAVPAKSRRWWRFGH